MRTARFIRPDPSRVRPSCRAVASPIVVTTATGFALARTGFTLVTAAGLVMIMTTDLLFERGCELVGVMDGWIVFYKNTASEALSTRVSGSSGDQINNY